MADEPAHTTSKARIVFGIIQFMCRHTPQLSIIKQSTIMLSFQSFSVLHSITNKEIVLETSHQSLQSLWKIWMISIINFTLALSG